MHDPYLLPLYVMGTLLVSGLSVTFIIFVIIQKQRQVKNRLERQRLEFNYSRSLLDTKIEVQETTLKMLSEELHDNINQILSSSLMQISAANALMEHASGKELLSDARATVRKAIHDIRLLSHSLNTGMVEHREIEEAVSSELDRITAFSGIACTLESEATHEPNPEQRLLLFRIVQEALQNIIKHAKARKIVVSMDSSESWFRLSLRDDGIGFNVDEKLAQSKSLGMRNMHERISLLRGTVKITSAPNEGTILALQIPLVQVA